MAAFSDLRGPEFGIFECPGQRCTPKATENGWGLEKNVQIFSPPISALNAHDRDRNLQHEMKKHSMVRFKVRISTAKAKRQTFTTPLLLAESKCK